MKWTDAWSQFFDFDFGVIGDALSYLISFFSLYMDDLTRFSSLCRGTFIMAAHRAAIIFCRCGFFFLYAPHYAIGQAIIFSSCGFLLYFCLRYILSYRRLDVYHTSTRDVVLVRI